MSPHAGDRDVVAAYHGFNQGDQGAIDRLKANPGLLAKVQEHDSFIRSQQDALADGSVAGAAEGALRIWARIAQESNGSTESGATGRAPAQ